MFWRRHWEYSNKWLRNCLCISKYENLKTNLLETTYPFIIINCCSNGNVVLVRKYFLKIFIEVKLVLIEKMWCQILFHCKYQLCNYKSGKTCNDVLLRNLLSKPKLCHHFNEKSSHPKKECTLLIPFSSKQFVLGTILVYVENNRWIN